MPSRSVAPKRRGRRAASDDVWRPVVAEFERSGLSRRAFCEETAVPLSTLNWWLTKARRAARVPTFTEVQFPTAVVLPASTQQPWALEIVTREGATIRYRDAVAVADLLRVLRDQPC